VPAPSAREPSPNGVAVDGLGTRVREHREAAGLSLRALAGRLGVSASLLSRIENDKAQPSVTTLYGLTAELGLSLDELFGGGGRAPAPATRPAGAVVARAGERRPIQMGAGVRWELLADGAAPDLELLRLTYEPGGTSSEDGTLLTHAGRETGLIVSGVMHVTVEDTTHVLGPGDSISFDSSLPHRFWNEGTEPVHAVWLNVGRHAGGAARVHP
jgi:transcriptional regulator with XRE-family HTH domain